MVCCLGELHLEQSLKVRGSERAHREMPLSGDVCGKIATRRLAPVSEGQNEAPAGGSMGVSYQRERSRAGEMLAVEKYMDSPRSLARSLARSHRSARLRREQGARVRAT